MSKLKRKGIFVDLAENYQVWCFFLILRVITVIRQYEIFDWGLLYPPSKIKSVGFKPLIPSRLFIPEIDDSGRLESVKALLFSQLVHIEVLNILYAWNHSFQLSRSLHAQEVALVLDICHGDSEIWSIDVAAWLLAMVIELVDRTSSVTS